MAKLIGGLGTSHVPSIAAALDKGLRDTPEFMALAHEVREGLAGGHGAGHGAQAGRHGGHGGHGH